MQKSWFMAWCRCVLILGGAEVAGLGSLSLRRGCVVSLFHGAACREAVTEALRHNSLLSSLPNVMDAIQMAGRAVTMPAAPQAPRWRRSTSSTAPHRRRWRTPTSSWRVGPCAGSARPSRGSTRAGWGVATARCGSWSTPPSPALGARHVDGVQPLLPAHGPELSMGRHVLAVGRAVTSRSGSSRTRAPRGSTGTTSSCAPSPISTPATRASPCTPRRRTHACGPRARPWPA